MESIEKAARAGAKVGSSLMEGLRFAIKSVAWVVSAAKPLAQPLAAAVAHAGTKLATFLNMACIRIAEEVASRDTSTRIPAASTLLLRLSADAASTNIPAASTRIPAAAGSGGALAITWNH